MARWILRRLISRQISILSNSLQAEQALFMQKADYTRAMIAVNRSDYVMVDASIK